ETALHAAAWNGEAAVVEQLISAGAKVDTARKDGCGLGRVSSCFGSGSDEDETAIAIWLKRWLKGETKKRESSVQRCAAAAAADCADDMIQRTVELPKLSIDATALQFGDWLSIIQLNLDQMPTAETILSYSEHLLAEAEELTLIVPVKATSAVKAVSKPSGKGAPEKSGKGFLKKLLGMLPLQRSLLVPKPFAGSDVEMITLDVRDGQNVHCLTPPGDETSAAEKPIVAGDVSPDAPVKVIVAMAALAVASTTAARADVRIACATAAAACAGWLACNWQPAPSAKGLTGLHCAAQKGHAAVVEQLISAKATVDVANNDGRGPGRVFGSFWEWLWRDVTMGKVPWGSMLGAMLASMLGSSCQGMGEATIGSTSTWTQRETQRLEDFDPTGEAPGVSQKLLKLPSIGQSKTGSIVQAFETLLSQRGTYSLEPGSVPVVLAPGGPARSFACWVEVLEPLRLPLARRRVTALHWAAENGEATVVEQLISAKATVDATNDDGRGPGFSGRFGSGSGEMTEGVRTLA
ncbi:unnamed protein product, partial [Cladocopium goreaui]